MRFENQTLAWSTDNGKWVLWTAGEFSGYLNVKFVDVYVETKEHRIVAHCLCCEGQNYQVEKLHYIGEFILFVLGKTLVDLEDEVTDEEKFASVWMELSDLGKCDGIDGAEYQQVFEDWKLAGKPIGGLRQFIIIRANMGPSGDSLADQN